MAAAIAELQILIFSKDRAMQLCAALESFQLHCKDGRRYPLAVLFAASTEEIRLQYSTLQPLFPWVRFVEEQDFKSDLLRILVHEPNHLCFIVDDTIFVRAFDLSAMLAALMDEPKCLGLSLRLGQNTTHCYPYAAEQAVPFMDHRDHNLCRYTWVGAEFDFGYPLEVSSSIFRTREILPLLQMLAYSNPNTLEAVLATAVGRFVDSHPQLLCCSTSVAFSNPLNKVQTSMPHNRAGDSTTYSVSELQRLFDQGMRIDVQSLSGHLSSGAHQELMLTFVDRPAQHLKLHPTPLVSVIIPCFEQAHYLPDSMASILEQTYPEWELIVVNEGAQNDTRRVVTHFIEQHPRSRIRLIEQQQAGLAEARNTGVRASRGEWILPLDADDCFAPNMLEETVRLATTIPGCNLVSAHMRCFGSQQDVWAVDPFDAEKILWGNAVPYASLYSKALWETVGGYSPILPFGFEDWSFWIAGSATIKQAIVPRELFLYRREQRVSMIDRAERHRSYIEACMHTLHWELYPEQTIEAAHLTLMSAVEDVLQEIQGKILRFPSFGQPYLWRGLYHEAQGQADQAIRDYQAAVKLTNPWDWQAAYRMLLLAEKSSRTDLILQAGTRVVQSAASPQYIETARRLLANL